MSGVINIRRDVSDKFYRYKMPRLISKVEGKGNGIKTVIPNMTEVARALSRPPMYPTKFFGCELGAQVIFDAANDRHIVNGAHDAEKLQSLLDTFIDKFVLCPSCKNPETDLVITKDEFIMRDCKACGAHLPVDMRHKLTTYIIKNPPVTAKKSKKDKKSKKTDRKDATEKASTPTENSAGSGDDDELTRQIEEGAANIPVAALDNDDDWAEDTSVEAVAARMKDLKVAGALAKLLDADDDGDEADDPVDQLAAFIRSNPDVSETDISAKATEFNLRDYKVCLTLASVYLTDQVLADDEVKKHAVFMLKYVKNEKCQRALLGGIERLVGIEHPELLPKVALILKALYDVDLVEEDVVLAWGDKPSKKYVDRKISKDIRAKAEPFLNWLREADEDNSDDE
ncbi:hypothetical protein BATDEDRAFT_37464 [Batrachochytrium dendrobatidis JAM81]|uniref:W2 domain-containing protein n=2 Tax=Batrachochytrium dendrobatidis TaxID=109871 RepID=F4PC83_BATDJ|nr:translation initiation factor eIF5 [Batrachochytrium dendrobatidis JAM81]EGF77070.1 hypothetical protein BATDEDRAFT_37464 [Batrachochytrium dendrobatidis JAM81]OAJ44823.1 hypothetical protein BDEG_28013 [Batrachochytrium dendrobatidis JEL423]|eukprot:XP_006682241.1 hypothetical protein BATDEDRAFT_37464 [Batrachochytrium dendrobatidis JAM81]